MSLLDLMDDEEGNPRAKPEEPQRRGLRDVEDEGDGYDLFEMLTADEAPRQIFPAAPNIVDDRMHQEIERLLRHHHEESNQPVTGKRVEEILHRAAEKAGRRVETPREGNRGWDRAIEGQRISVKSEAGGTIKRDTITISQLVVTYKDRPWGQEEVKRDATAVEVAHQMRHDFDRMVVLRAMACDTEVEYQLVEPPKELLLRVERSIPKGLEWAESQSANRTFNLFVRDDNGHDLFKLQFEGSRHKVSLGGLSVNLCTTHGMWVIPLGVI